MANADGERLVLAADVGGTNLNLALMAGEGGRVRILRKTTYPTASEPSLAEPVLRFLAEAARQGLPCRPGMACISGAGPVRDGRIPLTNAPWDIDGRALERVLGIPVHLVNDFMAVSHGILLMDVHDPVQLLPLPHGDGSTPEPQGGGTVLVVGAGTGLGVGFITRTGGIVQVHPSEGGHIGLPMTGDETLRLWTHLRKGFPGPPGAEAAVSGPGIGNLHAFLAASGPGEPSAASRAILALPAPERPAAIAGNRADPACRRAMELFVELYARVCAELAAVFMPTGGLFLAGGIAAKNADRFLEEGRFMESFERNYREHLDGIARATPVFIVRDYAISLYGVAKVGLDSLP